MTNPQITGYVLSERARGVSDADIRAALLTKGWVASDVDEAMGAVPTGAAGNVLPGVFDLIGESWALYTKNFQLYFLIMLLPVVASVIVYLMMGQYADTMMSGGGMGMSYGDMEGNRAALFPSMRLIGAGIFAAIISALAASFSTAGLLIALKEGTVTSPTIAWQKAGGVFVQYFFTSIVSGIIIGIGFVLLIIPGVYLLGRYGFASLITIFGNKGVGDSLSESKKLAQGREWTFAGKILGGSILISIAGNIVAGIAGAIVGFLPKIAEVVVTGGFTAISTGLITVFLFLLYKRAGGQV